MVAWAENRSRFTQRWGDEHSELSTGRKEAQGGTQREREVKGAGAVITAIKRVFNGPWQRRREVLSKHFIIITTVKQGVWPCRAGLTPRGSFQVCDLRPKKTGVKIFRGFNDC